MKDCLERFVTWLIRPRVEKAADKKFSEISIFLAEKDSELRGWSERELGLARGSEIQSEILRATQKYLAWKLLQRSFTKFVESGGLLSATRKLYKEAEERTGSFAEFHKKWLGKRGISSLQLTRLENSLFA